MPGRGGCRHGAGRKAAWRHTETQTIRVPVALKETILDIGKDLDQGEEIWRGRTCFEIKQLISQWETKCDQLDAAQAECVQTLLTELRDILAHTGRGRGRRCRQRDLQEI